MQVPRPTKRLRPTTTIGLPDGFAISLPQESPSKTVYKLPADLNFNSVFSTTSTTVQNATKKRRSNGSNRLKTPSLIAHDLRRKGPPERDMSSTKKALTARALKPPVFADQKLAAEFTDSILKRIHPVSLPKLVAESSKPKSLRTAPPPPPIIPPFKPQPVLKPLPPPPMLSPSKKGKEKETAQSHLRTISTTHIALATDLTSGASPASSLSIFLQGNKPDAGVPGEGKEDSKEIIKGFAVSPVKSGTKGKGFIRNGLADQTSNLFSRSQTAFTLWHKETHASLVSSTSRRPPSDLHLRILKILHYHPSPSSSPAFVPSKPIIAICRVLKKPKDEQLTDSLYPVLFSCPTSQSIQAPTDGFQEGKEVYVWRPWYFVDLGEPGIPLGDSLGDEDIEIRCRLGSGQPAARALLCSRFFVAKS